MKTHIAFPSIEQFRTTVKKVSDRCTHASIRRPKIVFTGTAKLHGTNAGISCSLFNTANSWAQSRSNVITPEDDNAGFAAFVARENKTFQSLLEVATQAYLASKTNVSDQSILTIFGEWCGGNIQKGVAIAELPKMFVVFGITVSSGTNEFGETRHDWFTEHQVSSVMQSTTLPDTIKSIYGFRTWKMAIDFTAPELVQNELGEITQGVEERCPVAAALGVNGCGEGVVWSADRNENPDVQIRLDDLTFKVKGSLHSSSKVTTLASVDIEKVSSIKEFADSVVTEARCVQGTQFLKSQGLDITNKNTGAFLKWITADVIKEESDTMIANGLDSKAVMPVVSKMAREWFFAHLEG